MLYFIVCKIVIRVRGISGPFEETITQLVNAPNTSTAKVKFEQHVRQRFAHMKSESFAFQYLTIADTI